MSSPLRPLGDTRQHLTVSLALSEQQPSVYTGVFGDWVRVWTPPTLRKELISAVRYSLGMNWGAILLPSGELWSLKKTASFRFSHPLLLQESSQGSHKEEWSLSCTLWKLKEALCCSKWRKLAGPRTTRELVPPVRDCATKCSSTLFSCCPCGSFFIFIFLFWGWVVQLIVLRDYCWQAPGIIWGVGLDHIDLVQSKSLSCFTVFGPLLWFILNKLILGWIFSF